MPISDRMVRADGSEFASGQWREGKRQGRGKTSFRDGSGFEGDFVAGKRSGLGVFTGADGSVFEATFEDGAARGFGMKWSKHGTLLCCGHWGKDSFDSWPVPRSSLLFGTRLSAAGQSLRIAGLLAEIFRF